MFLAGPEILAKFSNNQEIEAISEDATDEEGDLNNEDGFGDNKEGDGLTEGQTVKKANDGE